MTGIIIEGPLSKWTNVMKGWQFRYFVLDDNAGLLSYYTTQENMAKGARRGCVRLQGAVIGIDDEDKSTFTLRVDGKTFHFQARDESERMRWVRALEDTILRHSALYNRRQIISNVLFDFTDASTKPIMSNFDVKLTEADAYLELLIKQAKGLEDRAAKTTDISERESLTAVITNANALIETVKHTIVLLQIAKNSSQPTGGDFALQHHPSSVLAENASSGAGDTQTRPDTTTPGNIINISSSGSATVEGWSSSSGEEGESGSESDSEGEGAFFDATSNAESPSSEDEHKTYLEGGELMSRRGPADSRSRPPSSTDHTAAHGRTIQHSRPRPPAGVGRGARPPASSGQRPQAATENVPSETVPPIELPPTAPKNMNIKELDAIYEDEEEEDFAASMEGQRGVLSHLMSQVRIGMDLTKVTLPTFILERRSLLEMYADFFAHPDLFSSIVDHGSAEKRMLEVVRWYLSAFHAGRKSEVAKKPYNPILGEIFRCYWQTPLKPGTKRSDKKATDGPVPWASVDDMCFVAEQVSHHPPVSAFYAENVSKGIACSAHIWTKSKFLGMSVGVHNVGQGCINFLKHDEEYTCDFPSAYGRSIFTVPWIELGGNVTINCAKTGFTATIVFQTKPMLGGKKNQINAEVFRPNQKTPFMTIAGEWNGCMTATNENGEENVFVDVNALPVIKKVVKPVAEQQPHESRRLWKDVTYALKMKDVNAATEAKQKLEQKQREEAKERKEKNIPWKTKLFSESGENWVYNNSLLKQTRKAVLEDHHQHHHGDGQAPV